MTAHMARSTGPALPYRQWNSSYLHCNHAAICKKLQLNLTQASYYGSNQDIVGKVLT
ncbi:hypothetical protein HPP92_021238 [Vanilla planifolia]|uniref:Uncharacterized protein n=1 Tax=Vanilla planifolia TaxID=51239 RepID=A0A835Q7K9_VANPL|nr:hypothetical protein HPP92_021238 [Vanilla planifolia]